MSLLNIEKLLDFAIEAEIRGEEFYRQWIDGDSPDDVQKFFALMAEEENGHREYFKKLQEEIETSQKEVNIPPDYDEYFKIFIEVMSANEEEMKKISRLSEAIDLAKKMELDALLFYTDMKSFVHADHQKTMQTIIDEERQHFIKLEALAKKLS